MTERERYEKWRDGAWEIQTGIQFVKTWEAWQACAEEKDKEIALEKQNSEAIKSAIIYALDGLTDFEEIPVSKLNYLQVIRKLREEAETERAEFIPREDV